MAFLTKSNLQKRKITVSTVPEILDDDGNPGQIRFFLMTARQLEELQKVKTDDEDGLRNIAKRIAESLVDENGDNYLTVEDVMDWQVDSQTAVLKAMASGSSQGVESQGEGLGVATSSATPTN